MPHRSNPPTESAAKAEGARAASATRVAANMFIGGVIREKSVFVKRVKGHAGKRLV